MDVSYLRSKSSDELKEMLFGLKKELVVSLFQSKLSGNSSDVCRVGRIKKDIARMLTVLGERKRGLGSA